MRSRRSLAAVALTALACLATLAAPLAPQSEPELTLEAIMADPDWISRRPENPWWSDDGKTIYYQQKRLGSEIRDLFAVDAATGTTRLVEAKERAEAGAPGGDWNSGFSARVFTREGDVYLRDSKTRSLTQLTRTAAAEESPRFQTGERAVAFKRGDDWFVRDLAGGLERQAAVLRFEDDPEKKDPADDYLSRQQERLLTIVAQRRQRKEAREARERELQRDDPTRAPRPFYLGTGKVLIDNELSPNGRWLLLLLGPEKPEEGKKDKMPDFITASGYVETRDVRAKVGTPKPETPKVVLLDLVEHTQHDIALDSLPGLTDDPLKELREKAEAAKKARAEARKAALAKEGKPAGDERAAATKGAAEPAATASDEKAADKAPATDAEAKKTEEEKKPAPRIVSIDDVLWSRDGSRVALQIFSFDNKDRWIAVLEPREKKLVPLERITDPAWINWDFRELGWMRDSRRLWYLSEETAFAHLFVRDVEAAAAAAAKRQITRGEFTVSDPVLARDGQRFFVTANREHPGVTETYRVDLAAGTGEPAMTRLSRFGGMSDFVLSPDESRLALLSSSSSRPPELFVQESKAGATARQLTRTVTPEFEAWTWSTPEIVAVPSAHGSPTGARAIYSRVYTPRDWTPEKKYPAVAFVHGAGYLQNAHRGWSSYFREYLFHNLLVRRGYVVIDMDYRGSAGYGRDWRTAIYRQMGTPELEDYEDGVAWLVAHKSVDPGRVGVYGGSYGGFMTFMALFKRPDLFACGAALRPVADWAHYNHRYTSNILNTPEVDPEAYERSSPIEFAEGLAKPLLILHGMVDDNVVFQDSVRLVQKLIELKKTAYFETAIYPIEPHGFREPESWLDEYARILRLMEENLGDR
jgi:dipeptidyl aminopeptidase/acylaminoacyl peptidase